MYALRIETMIPEDRRLVVDLPATPQWARPK